MKVLRKKTQEILLSQKFVEHSLVSNGSSNNGYFYILEKDGVKTYVKVVDSEQEDEEGLDETLLNQISSSSEHVAHILGSGELDDKYKYMQFDFIDGKDLSATKIQLSNDDLTKLAKDITLAISDLWKNKIVHRDIKPGNIMLTNSGNYILVDLGIGYYMETQDRDNTKSKGSRYYSSPEQFFSSTDSRVEISFSSDLYSLGMVLFELASGSHPKSSWKSKGCYGELITQSEPPKIEEYRNDLSRELTSYINKLVSIYPGDRFLSPQEAIEFLDGKLRVQSQNRLFLHDRSNDYSVIDKYLAGEQLQPDGIVVGILQSKDRIKSLKQLGLEIIIDPQTHRLPHPSASNSDLKKKLGYKKKAPIDAVRVRQDIQTIIKNTLDLQEQATKFVLPYFAIRNLEDDFTEINKLVWRSGKSIAREIDDSKEVYGGLAIASSIIDNEASVNKLINLLISQYDLDGFYVAFEAPNEKVKTIDISGYLEGVKKIISVLKSMGKVIIGYGDVSYLLINDGVDVTVGWTNSKRRFLYSNELDGNKAGFIGKDYDPKLLYYVPQLVTFVKDETELETLYRSSPENSLDCACDQCVSLNPFDGISPKDLGLAELHYYQAIINQSQALNSNPEVNKRQTLQDASTLAGEINKLSSGTVISNNIIPSHETILSVLNK